ncbi:MBL fold metallo-hydrolase [Clostridium fallax]|uniref:7,8-dihydropterin-6-yl-methyl-4-(Beta-D-ribofuranosyl)aminobenzene 5'-phosphate synthase n=1 Tax=Clostridium fallax TaxID=1533 RepID=A0A1M4WBZ0_9CLOT|nr:MBL fold metallo-hydrolase [Clostridium fallax]SHE78749.1 7,8-dihydropterin-6-yl-methyl-4-(beta-D-ribofuranosyl)aminobenzene 5'-phosphate synthase [Clostridium fallax]SQB05903.1 dihydropteroate synthase [Clostridium fallax]
MKITTVIENSLGENKELINEHGLSFFIEAEDKNILFDTGKSGEFISNANNLAIDFKNIDYLVLSHAHYDHCGGVRGLLDKFSIKPELYVGKSFFDNKDKYHYCSLENASKNQSIDFISSDNEYKYIGIDFDKKYLEDKNININFVEDFKKICDNVYLFSSFERKYDFETLNPNMLIKKDDHYEIDNFNEEIALVLDTEKGLIILLGCSHPGILNMITSINKQIKKPIYAVIGGTHLIEADEDRIEKTIDEIKKLNIKLVGASHCTGEKAVNIFEKNCDGFFKNYTGKELTI